MPTLKKADDGVRVRASEKMTKTTDKVKRVEALARVIGAHLKAGKSIEEAREAAHVWLIEQYMLSSAARADYIKSAFVLLRKEEQFKQQIAEQVHF